MSPWLVAWIGMRGIVWHRKKGSFVYVPEILMLHRIHEDSETTKQLEADGQRFQEDYAIFSALLANLYCKNG